MESSERYQGTQPTHLVFFRVNNREFALPVVQVVEILRMAALTRIPDAPEWLAGMLNLRGQVTPIVDLRARLGLVLQPLKTSARVIILQANATIFGLAVDSVDNVIPVSETNIETGDATHPLTQSIAGIVRIEGRLIPILDYQPIVADLLGAVGQL
jgi:purine-binding chemotaxis protein CheW